MLVMDDKLEAIFSKEHKDAKKTVDLTVFLPLDDIQLVNDLILKKPMLYIPPQLQGHIPAIHDGKLIVFSNSVPSELIGTDMDPSQEFKSSLKSGITVSDIIGDCITRDEGIFEQYWQLLPLALLPREHLVALLRVPLSEIEPKFCETRISLDVLRHEDMYSLNGWNYRLDYIKTEWIMEMFIGVIPGGYKDYLYTMNLFGTKHQIHSRSSLPTYIAARGVEILARDSIAKLYDESEVYHALVVLAHNRRYIETELWAHNNYFNSKRKGMPLLCDEELYSHDSISDNSEKFKTNVFGAL